MTKVKSDVRIGRPCVFRDKAGGDRVQGEITRAGSVRFEAHRRALGKLAPHVKHPSDADVIEYLAIGEAATRDYITRHATD